MANMAFERDAPKAARPSTSRGTSLRMNRYIFAAVFAIWSVSAFTGTCNIINGKIYGDCKGVSVNTDQKGNLIVTTAVTESGMIDGAVVKRGGSLQLFGMSIGDITVETGALLEVNGIVNGSIISNGGKVRINGKARSVRINGGSLEVSGMVDSVNGDGTINYRKGAVINGMPVQ